MLTIIIIVTLFGVFCGVISAMAYMRKQGKGKIGEQPRCQYCGRYVARGKILYCKHCKKVVKAK